MSQQTRAWTELTSRFLLIHAHAAGLSDLGIAYDKQDEEHVERHGKVVILEVDYDYKTTQAHVADKVVEGNALSGTGGHGHTGAFNDLAALAGVSNSAALLQAGKKEEKNTPADKIKNAAQPAGDEPGQGLALAAARQPEDAGTDVKTVFRQSSPAAKDDAARSPDGKPAANAIREKTGGVDAQERAQAIGEARPKSDQIFSNDRSISKRFNRKNAGVAIGRKDKEPRTILRHGYSILVYSVPASLLGKLLGDENKLLGYVEIYQDADAQPFFDMEQHTHAFRIRCVRSARGMLESSLRLLGLNDEARRLSRDGVSDSARDAETWAIDGALLMRAYLLANISLYRTRIRGIFEQTEEHVDRLEAIDGPKPASDAGRRRGNYLRHTRERLKLYEELLDEQEHGREPHGGFARARWRLEDALAGLSDFLGSAVFRHVGWGLAALYCGVLWTWLAWPWLQEGLMSALSLDEAAAEGLRSGVGFTLIGLTAAASVPFLLVAFNLQTLRTKIEGLIYEGASEDLDRILLELAEKNAGVAAMNIRRDDAKFAGLSADPVPDRAPRANLTSEPFLRALDQVLHVRDSVVSLQKVIKTQQGEMVEYVKHIREAQQRARRSVTAAAGGIFTGFFTFEVGEKVMIYNNLLHHEDSASQTYWLVTQVLPGAIGAKAKTVEEVHAPGHEALKSHEDFHQSELKGHSLLLLITMLVTVIAAGVAWRKPVEEKSGAGEHE